MEVFLPTETTPGPCLLTEAAAAAEEEEAVEADFKVEDDVPLELLVLLDLALPLLRLEDFFLSSEDEEDDDFFFLSLSLLLFFFSSDDEEDEDFFFRSLSLSLLLLFFFLSSDVFSPSELLRLLLFFLSSSFLSSFLSSLTLLDDLPKRGIFDYNNITAII